MYLKNAFARRAISSFSVTYSGIEQTSFTLLQNSYRIYHATFIYTQDYIIMLPMNSMYYSKSCYKYYKHKCNCTCKLIFISTIIY